MGFCLYNNVAVAVEHARATLGIARSAIVDIDVHHGNGTEAIFRDDDSVLFVSLHQWPFYPGSGGPDDQAETTLNVPLRAGSGDEEYLEAFARVVEPAVERFEPELVLVSAGFDAHDADPLSDMRVTEDGFRELARRCRALSDRVAAVLEGGYDLATWTRPKPTRPSAWHRDTSLPAPGHVPTRHVRCLTPDMSRVSGSGERELLERLAPRGDAELAQEAFDVRADGVLGDEEPLRDLVRAMVLVEQEQHLELAGGENRRDAVRHARAAAAGAHLVEQPARDRRETGLSGIVDSPFIANGAGRWLFVG